MVFFFFNKNIFERGVFFRENLTVVFIFYPKLFFFLGVIRNFCFRIESGGLKKKKNERGVLLGKI